MKDIPLIVEIKDPRFINEHLPATILVTKADECFTILEANNEYFNLIGYSAEEIKSNFANKGYETLHSKDRDKAIENLLLQVKYSKNGTFSVNCRLVNKQHGYKMVNFRGKYMSQEDGDDIYCFLITDISDETDILQELEEEKEFNELIASFTDNIYFDYDIVKDVMRCSQAFAEKLGVPTVLRRYSECITDMNIITRESFGKFIDKISNTELIDCVDEYEFITIEGYRHWYLTKFKKCSMMIMKL